MDESKRRVAKFVEKEIKTYTALSLFFSKKGVADRLRMGNGEVLISPAFYQERMKEAKKLVSQLRKTDLSPQPLERPPESRVTHYPL